MAKWKLEDAKNQFSKLVRAARRRPQVVTRYGREEVVVMSVETYRQHVREQPNVVDFLSRSPLAAALATGDLELVRSRDRPRDVAL